MNDSIEAKHCRRNFFLFTILYSTLHAAAASVLAFTSAELGPKIGSIAGFLVYVLYMLSSLLLSKPAQRQFGTRMTLIIGELSLLCYVISFLLALASPPNAMRLFVTGAVIAGLGSAVLWASQSSYYSLNANEYASKSNQDITSVLIKFASIFSVYFLSLEASLSMFATIIYVICSNAGVKDHRTWKYIVFGLYGVLAMISFVLYFPFVKDYPSTRAPALSSNSDEETQTSNHKYKANTVNIWLSDVSAVSRVIISHRRLQLLIPYQISFGFSFVMINYLVGGFVVSRYLGDGYIGILWAIATITAAVSSRLYGYIGNAPNLGRWYVMMFSCVCMFVNGCIILLPAWILGTWFILVPYYVIHGAVRGAWESTNKAVVADFFQNSQNVDVAFATIYFLNGISSSFCYIFYKYMNSTEIAIMNITAALVAAYCYHLSEKVAKDPMSGDGSYERVASETVSNHLHSNIPTESF